MTNPAPAIAPYVPNYATYTPYITPAEFLNAPTGVDTSQLVPAGSVLTQEAALVDLIARASGEADKLCRKVLAATLDVAVGEFRIFRDQTLRIPVPYTPIVAVVGVSVGYQANSLTPLTDLSGLWIERKVVRVPVPQLPFTAAVAFSTNPPAMSRPGRMFVQMQYVNGWAHSTLAAATLAGAASITPLSVVGFAPNLPFTVKDGASTESAVVASTYVMGSATVPLASPLQNAHGQGATVSALPPIVKDAVIDLVKWLVKSRGSKAIVMGSIKGQPLTAANAKTQTSEPGGTADYNKAVKTLQDLGRSR